MADKKFSTKRFGDTYYPITQNQMSNNRFKNFTGDKEFGSREDLNKYHKKLKEKLYKENVRPSEIAKLDKEFKARMKRANDDLQYRLSNRAGMKEERKKQKGTIPDTGSAFSRGGEMLKGKQKKLDKNKDGKISGEDFKMMKAKYGKMTSTSTKGNIRHGKLKSQEELKKITDSKEYKNSGYDKKTKMLNVATAKSGKMMKAKKGEDIDIIEAISNISLMGQRSLTQMKSAAKSAKKKNMGGEMKQGYGAARTSGMGLQDENLIPGKSLDYYKDVM